jgi:hypothetical protein
VPLATPQQTPPSDASRLKIDIYSRHLQWLRTADEVAEAAIEMGYDGVNLTVRPYPGHVNPKTSQRIAAVRQCNPQARPAGAVDHDEYLGR